MNGLDVWATRFVLAHILNNSRCICPVLSHAINIGLDGSGTHCGYSEPLSKNHQSDEIFQQSRQLSIFQQEKFQVSQKSKELPNVDGWFFSN